MGYTAIPAAGSCAGNWHRSEGIDDFGLGLSGVGQLSSVPEFFPLGRNGKTIQAQSTRLTRVFNREELDSSISSVVFGKMHFGSTSHVDARIRSRWDSVSKRHEKTIKNRGYWYLKPNLFEIKPKKIMPE
jgi:hypothetical protein